MAENKSKVSALVIGIIISLCCICVIVAGVLGYGYFTYSRSSPITDLPIFPGSNNVTSTPEPQIVRPYTTPNSGDTLEVLKNTVVPSGQQSEQVCRFSGICNIPDVMTESAVPHEMGETSMFWVTDLDANENKQIKATLQYMTPHVYFWVQNGVSYDTQEMKALIDTFENKIYPTNREFFGSEWSPGIDGDEHIYILYSGGLGSTVAGYFSSADLVHPLVNEFSNAHEMFLFNADNTPLGDESTYGVLAHEFQHMIHWNQDSDEATWMNEGLSELAALLNGYNPGGFDWLYINQPDLQLNDWSNAQGTNGPHYGASFLFTTYFLDRFGETATQTLIKDPANGFDGVDNVLKQINAIDPATGQLISSDDLFMDWAVTNLTLDASIGDGRYIYKNYPDATRGAATETIINCPQGPLTRDVHQYGVDYIAIECTGDFTLSFTGSTVTKLLPVNPYSGAYAFWSNKGDESDMTLTREFDFTNVSGPIEFSYQTWFDIEKDWDYLYLEVSEDGQSWQIMSTPSGTADDPMGNSYGWGYTGTTNGWVEETIDLSQYAGKKVFVRFEYITDGATNGEGFLLDDVSVEAAGYRSDFEADDGGWAAEGFARVQNVLPQTFRLALLLTGNSSVKMIPLNEDQTAQIPLNLQPGEKAFLVVSGTTRFTREIGTYQIEIK